MDDGSWCTVPKHRRIVSTVLNLERNLVSQNEDILIDSTKNFNYTHKYIQLYTIFH